MPTDALSPYRETIAGTLVTFDMVPVPGGTVELPGPGGTAVTVDPVWIGRTEVTWDLYDVYALSLDLPETERAAGGAGERSAGDEPDAVARPSRPYGAPDYGWGHTGYPAMSVTREAAQAFCEWLSARTGKRYRLPTEAEWLHAATLAVATRAGSTGGERPPEPLPLDSIAWHAGNANGTTHPVAAKRPDALGLHDLLGNVAEWVIPTDSIRVVRGGSFDDEPAAFTASLAPRAAQDASWNERDPQLPKSRWWLSDGPFIGFRIVRER